MAKAEGKTMAPAEAKFVAAVRDNRGWFIAIGVILILVGTAAVLFPQITTIAAERLIGWVFVFAGFSQIVHAFWVKDWGAFIWEFLVGVIQAIAGILLLAYPIAGVVTLTLLLAAILVVEGVLRVIASVQIRPDPGWGWMLTGGILSVVLGILLWMSFPSSAVWAVGLLVGLNIIMSGWTLLMIAFAAEKAVESAEDGS